MNKLLIAVVLMAPSAFATEIPDPIAHWKMDRIVEGKVPDETGNGHDLSLQGDCFLSNTVDNIGFRTTSAYNPGTQGSALAFDCPALGSRTFVVNVRRETGDGPLPADVNAIPYLLWCQSSMNIEMNRGDATMRPWFQGFDGASAVYPVNSFETGTRGTWRQLAFVVDIQGTDGDGQPTGEMRCFVDGKQVRWVKNIAFPKSLAREMPCLVGNTSAGDRPLFGHVGEMRLYDTALTAEQIVQLGMEPAHGTLMARWNMNRIVTDGSGGRYVEDDSVRGIPLKMGSALTIEDDLDGGALKFNPTDAESIAESWCYAEVPCETKALTVSTWYKVSPTLNDTAALDSDMPRIWVLSGSGDLRFMINNNLASAAAYDRRLDVYADNAGAIHWGSNTAYVERDRWAHLTVVAWITEETDGNVIHFDTYVNGEKSGVTKEGATSLTCFQSAATPKILLGGCYYERRTSGFRSFKGSLDDVRVYAGRLTDEEVRAVWRGPATVDAGADFTVASETATLRGAIGAGSGLPYRQGFAGDVSWTLVSAPAGGESAVIEQPKGAETRVTLPAAGEYVFRLATTAMGVSNADEVRVTRIAPVAGNQPPTVGLSASVTFPFQGRNALAATVADPDQGPGTLRVIWKKVSGPGGVWFSDARTAATEVSFSAVGEYVLRCTADDGQDAVSSEIAVTVTSDAGFDPVTLTSGLFAYYPFTDGARTNFIAGGNAATMPNFDAGARSQHFDPALDGLGYRGYGDTDYANLGATGLGESGQTNVLPDERWRTISLWMYHDPSGRPGGCIPYNPSLVSQQYAFDLIYFDNPDNGSHGFWLYQAWDGRRFGCPAKDPAGRWTHVVAMLDRRAEAEGGDTSELWIDGVQQSVAAGPSSLKSRSSATAVAIGGSTATDRTQTFTPDGRVQNDKWGLTTRTFAGVIDEVRFYNRRLTGEEIRYLATHPVRDEHNAPSVTAAADAKKSVAREPVAVEVTANGDGLAYDAALTYEWQVLSGDADKLTFGDRTARSTTVTAKKAGRYVVQLRVCDGERTTYSDPITLDVDRCGMVLFLR